MDKIYLYQLDDKTYEVIITYKRIRNIHYRYDGEKFLISCPRLCSMHNIKSGLDKYAKKLIERDAKSQAVTAQYIYLLGQKYDLNYPGELLIDETLISFKDNKELNNKLRKWFLKFITERTIIYEKKMNAPHFEMKVRQMKSRYGSNNRTSKVITYSTILMHYSLEIIDSVIIHELAHHFVYDHSANFYKVVYQYCPNYDSLRKKLIKADFA